MQSSRVTSSHVVYGLSSKSCLQAQRDKNATTLLVILAKIEKMRGAPKPAYTHNAPYAAVRVKSV